MKSILVNCRNGEEMTRKREGIKRKADSLKFAMKKAREKGVRIKIALPPMKQTPKHVKELAKLADMKVAKDIKARFVLVDGKELTFMILDDKDTHPTYDLGIWVSTPFFVGAIETMFNTMWPTMDSQKK